MTNKVVYNSRFGGFSLSADAVRLGKSLSADKHWAEVDERYGFYDGPRHDPTLVGVVEQLGDRANGSCASLRIAELTGNQYRIEEYDGAESVLTPEDGEVWVFIE